MPSSHIPPDSTSKSTDIAAPANRSVHTPPFYYQFGIGLLKPLYRLQVWRRSHNRENYPQEVEQRFGKRYPARPSMASIHSGKDSSSTNNRITNNGSDVSLHNKGVIWCHAVSLGETNTVAPLLDALLADGYQIWLTNTTQTGFARGASRFAEQMEQGQMSHSYVPVDSPAVIEKFLTHVQPVAALFVETELWANILTKLSEHHIPSILVNGRLSASSFQSYQKIGAVSASMMKNLTLIIAQDNESAKRFRQLGAHSAQIRVAGSLKWVINTPKIINEPAHLDDKHDDQQKLKAAEQKAALAEGLRVADRTIWVAASTHSGEEETALALHKQLLSNRALATTLLIIVPRHPERFDEVAELIQNAGLKMARRSTEDTIDADTQVYLADSMGELMTWYALADVALVGGSLVDIGGHNPVEPASVATPVIMGRYTQSCQSVVDKLSEVGALYQPNNAFYQPANKSRAAGIDKQAATQNTSSTSQPTSRKSSASDDTALIYQQLVSWLDQPELATRAGQAGAQITRQQQAVLPRQLAMITGVIEKHLSSEIL
ncbi:3-deoxy-D-manno-octulosonic acid transferase [Psychrobacter sp. B38]|uniref:3-deoxy-D-manno-octulosonic acid transferase n=1 Tax=Psychrobacter sp. B38 TaxID=3143538 RepID=UPI00320D07F3